MDYLRDRLRYVYGAQVACYSGRGGERWENGKWVGVSKESIKSAFRESREVKILLCTESASEGLNLQTCGVLINYDMPWNPMRVEQRIGRIDRIGQTYERVWVRNYFYEQTVEADIYHRLDDRIGSFEHVVGELQPILTRVGRAIEAAAMAGQDRREQLITQAVATINAEVQSAEAGALNLDKLVDDEVGAPVVAPPPVTMPELERALVTSAALGARFQAHPTIVRAHLLDWNGQMHPVTFDPAVYDDHPNTVRLLTYGNELLANVLATVDPPQEAMRGGQVARCTAVAPVESVGWYAVGVGQASPIRTFANLQEVLRSPGKPDALVDAAMTAARERFDQEMRPLREREANDVQALHRSRADALAEEIRDLLLQAAYVELAKTAAEGIFAGDSGAGFSIESVRRLRRHKVPFAGSLKVVTVDGLRLSATDPKYVKLAQSRSDQLDRRFEAIKNRLAELLSQFVAFTAKTAEGASEVSPTQAVRIAIFQTG
jgi:hypothetical protein